MAIFYFDTEDGGRHEDLEGVELADLATAKMEAVTMTGEMLRDRPDDLWASRGLRMTVADENHRPLFVIRVEAAPASAQVYRFGGR
jgi:hypothetical protein